MKFFNRICEKLIKFEEKLVKTYDSRFSVFESKMLAMVDKKINCKSAEGEVSFVFRLVTT